MSTRGPLIKDGMSDETKVAVLDMGIQSISDEIKDGFTDLKNELKNYSTKAELQLAVQERDSKIKTVSDGLSTLSKEFTTYKTDGKRRTQTSTVLATVISIVVTFLVTYFLNDISH